MDRRAFSHNERVFLVGFSHSSHKKKKAIRAIPMLGTATRSGGLDPEEVPAVTDSQAGGIVMALIPRRWEGKEK